VDGVLNWIWQGCVVAIAAAGLLRVTEPSRAHVRYWSLWLVLGVILLLPLIPSAGAEAVRASDVALMATPQEGVVTIPATWWTSTRMLILPWACWVAVFLWRIGRAATSLRRAKRACRPVSAELEGRLPRWNAIRVTGRRTRLMRCEHVTSAAVLLGRAPIIAVAPRLLEQLTDEELDRVVIHEWAHVQRRDDLALLVQLIAGAGVGWHPAVWWCSRQLHVEREMACDEMAIALTGSAKAYAACLAKLATLPPAFHPALPAVAAMSASGVRRRITRAVAFDGAAMRRTRVTAVLTSSLVLGLTAFTVGGFRLIAAAPVAAAAAEATPGFGASRSTMVTDSAPLEHRGQVIATARSAAAHQDPRRSEVGLVPRPRAAHVSGKGAMAATAQSINEVAASTQDGDRGALVSRPVAAVSAVVNPPSVAIPSGSMAETAGPSSSSASPAAAPWGAAVDASVTVGRESQRAAVATAGFFSRLGRRLGGSF
jgi:beta-lactamase regulating signal transducer with metallopeptidase domain